MSSAWRADAIVDAYLDQLEALHVLDRSAAVVLADPNSRFAGLTLQELLARTERDRAELDRWALLALVASFEATLRLDVKDRTTARPKHPVTKPLRDLFAQFGDRLRLEDLLATWEKHVVVPPAVQNAIRILLKHRHWLAHGRHWTNKYGALPSPLDARADIDDYFAALRGGVGDFPRA